MNGPGEAARRSDVARIRRRSILDSRCADGKRGMKVKWMAGEVDPGSIGGGNDTSDPVRLLWQAKWSAE